MKEDMYITLVSMRHFFGVKPFKKDGILKLIKEKDNNYDDEAITLCSVACTDRPYILLSL